MVFYGYLPMLLRFSCWISGIIRSSTKVEDFCKKGARVEVLAPSNRWREAQVVRVGGGVARIHYTGYDAQFDEEVALDNQRLRPFGQIRSEKLKERKENFVLQMDAGCCPGCGVKLQCTDKMALGQAWLCQI